MSAVERTFGVFELLEAVLIDVPLVDLVLTTAVCQTFRDTTSSSKCLRDRLVNEHIPMFVCLQPGSKELEDICNVDKTSPWFFRSQLENGVVLVLRLDAINIQLLIPHDTNAPVHRLDSRRTEGDYSTNEFKTTGWARWYNGRGDLVCEKSLSASRFLIRKPDSIWPYLETFNRAASDCVDCNEKAPVNRCPNPQPSRNNSIGHTTFSGHQTRTGCRAKNDEPSDGWLTD